MPERWQFERVGMGYRCWADVIQTEFQLTHIYRSRRGELTGQLSIKTNMEGVKTRNGVLHVARLNVLSSPSRSALAKLLEKRTNGLDMDWNDGIEWLCQSVIEAEAEGEEIDLVGHEPAGRVQDHFLVEPLVMKGRAALLFGPGGVGKSLIALTCALSVATGREIIPGISPAMHGPVLYLDWETTKEVINDRIQAIAAGHGFKPENVFYRHCVRPLADDAEQLSMFVAEKKIIFVVVDSAAYAMGAQGEYGDANESVLRLHEGLRIIGTASQIVDHVNKTDAKSKGGTASPYGSAYKTNAARISWELRKAVASQGLSVNLYHAKSNDTPLLEPRGIHLDWEPGRIHFDANEVLPEEAPTGESTHQAIIETLEVYGRLTSSEVCQHLSFVNAVTVRSNLSRMVARGQLAVSEGKYAIIASNPPKLRSLSQD